MHRPIQLLLAAGCFVLAFAAPAAAPTAMTFQGRVSVEGIPFSGAGHFRFALIDNAETVLWTSAADTDPADGIPDAAIELPVAKGLYAVQLGRDTRPLPDELFEAHADLKLRVWFDDGTHGVQRLSPDQALTGVPYARRSAAADTANRALSYLGPVGAAQVTGALSEAQLPQTVARLDGSPVFEGTVRAAGFAGPGTLAWQRVTTAEVRARPNTGYLYDGEDVFTLTLPRDARPGDAVRLALAQGAGWRALAETGGRLLGAGPGRYWNTGGYAHAWRGLAISADGMRLAAAASSAPITLSADAGGSWFHVGSARAWSAVASSADGTRLAAAERDGSLWISRDSGATWVARGEAGPWTGIASSADGLRLVAMQYKGDWAVSVDGGETWAKPVRQSAVEAVWSADGGTLGLAHGDNLVSLSYDGGAIWNRLSFGVGISREPVRPGHSDSIFHLAGSADGSRWVCAGRAGGISTWDGANLGTEYASTETQGRQWSGIACSADGTRILAAETGGPLWFSVDRGRHWIRSAGAANWTAVACSADGLTIAAAAEGEEIATSVAVSEGDAAVTGEFVYAGGGRWKALALPALGPDLRLAPNRVPTPAGTAVLGSAQASTESRDLRALRERIDRLESHLRTMPDPTR